MNIKKINIMVDYDCFPLWNNDIFHYEYGNNVDPNLLPISSELKQDLMTWAEEYDNTLCRECPQNSGFINKYKLLEFVEQGRCLYERLKNELGSSWEIDYFPFGRKWSNDPVNIESYLKSEK